MKRISLAFTLLFISIPTVVWSISVAEINNDDRIYDRNAGIASVGEFPYVVAIKVNEQFRCGGFIYNARWAVTTATCVDDLDPASVTIEAGKVQLDLQDENAQLLQVLAIKIYDSFNATTKLHNIALLETASLFSFNANVSFAYYDETKEGNKGDFMAWGATQEGGPLSNNLRNTTFTCLPEPSNCTIDYGDDYYNKSYMVCCAGTDTGYNDNNSPCPSDAGSPFVQNGHAIGIMSWNLGCVETDPLFFKSTIFTRLSAYYTWLTTTAGPQPMP